MAKKLLFETELTAIESNDVEGVGKIREDAQGNTDRWVKNTHSTTVTQYGACVYNGATRTECTKAVTLVTSPTCYTNIAGFWHAAVTTGAFGWIRCKGAATVIIASDIARVMGELFGIEGAVETLTTIVASTQASNATFGLRNARIYSPTSVVSTNVTSTATMIVDCML